MAKVEFKINKDAFGFNGSADRLVAAVFKYVALNEYPRCPLCRMSLPFHMPPPEGETVKCKCGLAMTWEPVQRGKPLNSKEGQS